jgi:hypothetical protein
MSVTIKSSRRAAWAPWRNRALVAAAVLASATAVCGVRAAHAAAATPTLLSYSSPARLIQSTGNLYWTSNTYDPFRAAPYESFVWRAAKTNMPGHEIPIFSQSSATPFSFGDVTYAQVAGNWYGYFVFNNPVTRTSRIERIGLTPTASATILRAGLPLMGKDDLVTDGSYLYWADAGAIRAMPIGGGAPRVLASGTNFSRVGIDTTKVFYSAGNAIRSVSKTGGASTPLVTAASRITAMDLNDQWGYDELAYGEANGSVIENTYLLPTETTVQVVEPARAGYSITTVGMNDGLGVDFGECLNGTSCDIDGTTGTGGTPVDVQGDGSSLFWGSNGLYSLADQIIF